MITCFVVKDSFELTIRELIVVIGDVKSGEVQAGMYLRYNDAELLIRSVETITIKDRSFVGLMIGFTTDAFNLVKEMAMGDEVLIS